MQTKTLPIDKPRVIVQKTNKKSLSQVKFPIFNEKFPEIIDKSRLKQQISLILQGVYEKNQKKPEISLKNIVFNSIEFQRFLTREKRIHDFQTNFKEFTRFLEKEVTKKVVFFDVIAKRIHTVREAKDEDIKKELIKLTFLKNH